MRHLLVSVAFLALAATPAMAAQTAESKACSAQATAKALHGAEREKFMGDCKAAAAPAAVKPAAPMAAAKPAAKPVATAMPAAPMAAPARGFAPKTAESKACSDQATAKGLKGKDRETFRKACLSGAPAPMAAAAPVAAAKPVAAPAKPSILGAMFGPKPAAEAVPPEPTAASMKASSASGKPRTANQLAADQRIKKCGAMWQADKAAGKLATGAKWPAYWSACSARLKAAA